MSADTRTISLLRYALVVILGGVLSVLMLASSAYAATNSQLNFQARLLSDAGDLVDDGFYHAEFKLYSTATGGAELWTETYTGANTLRLANGYLSANLGSLTPFPATIDWSEELWLGVNVGGNGASAVWDGEMVPRTTITAVPYAFAAGALQGTGGQYGADDFVQVAPTNIQSLNEALAAIRLDQTGAGGLLQLQGDGSDVLTVSKTGATFVAGAVDIDGDSVDIGSATQSGALILNDGSGNTITLQPGGSQAADLVFSLPSADGASGQCLQTDGSGVLSFGVCGGGAGDILDGGNTNSASITIGTNDGFDFNIETDGATRANFQADGDIDFGSNTLFIDDVNDAVNVAGASTLEALNVNGSINLGNTTNSNAGSIRWTGTDFEGYDGVEWRSLTLGENTGGQFVSNASTNINTAAYVAVPFDAETFKTVGVTHDSVVDNSRITLDDPGLYYVTYSVSYDATDANRRNVECSVRLNGASIITESTSYSYTRDTTNDKGTNTATTAIVTSAANDYYEVVCIQEGTGGVANLIPGQSWTTVSTNTGGGAATVTVDNSTTTTTNYILGGSGAYAHGKVTGATGALIGGSGASTVRNSVGNYTVTLNTGLSNADYTILLSLAEDGADRDAIIAQVAAQSTGAFDVTIHEGDNGGTAGVLRDRDWFFTVVTDEAGTPTSGPFIQGGNSFGSDATLGTNDAQGLSFETDDTIRMTIDSAGNITAIGDVSLDGSVDLGDASTDAITFNGQVASDVLPNADDAFDLGSATLRCQDLYLGPASLHVVCNAGECGAARDWSVGIEESAGPAQGNLTISLSGTDYFSLTPTGNVGIGDTTPDALFTVGANDAFQVDASGNISTAGGLTLGGAISFSEDVTFGADILGATPLVFQGATDNAIRTSFAITDPTAARTVTFPDASGVVCLEGGDCGFVQIASGTPQVDASSSDSLAINKTGAGGNILRLEKNGNGVLTIANDGAFNLASDSTTAMQVTDSSGATTFFSVDTVNGVVTVTSAAADSSGLRLANLTSSSPTSAGQPIGVDANGNVVAVAGASVSVTGDYDTPLAGTDLSFADSQTYALADLSANTTFTASSLTVGNRYGLLIRTNAFSATLPSEVEVIEGSLQLSMDNHVQLEVVSGTKILARIYSTPTSGGGGDLIQANLTTSLAAYSAAANDDWVQITQAEYDALAVGLGSVTEFGLADADYTTVARTYLGDFTFGNTAATMPANSYVFAFKYASNTANVPAGGKFQVSSTSPNSGYAQLGSTLPAHSPTADDAYFVIKGNTIQTTATGYAAIWTGSNVAYGPGGGTASDLVWFNGDGQPANTFTNGPAFLQGLSTTVQQW